MDFIRIDMETYPRRAHFDYFRTMAYPYAGMTANIDVTNLLAAVKDRKLPFFLTALYLAANAANAVPELRRRIRDGGIVEYSNCKTSHTVALPDGTYCYCMLDCSLPFGEFIPYAAAKQDEAGTEPCLDDGDEADSLFFFSSVPWVSYTSIVQPTPSGGQQPAHHLRKVLSAGGENAHAGHPACKPRPGGWEAHGGFLPGPGGAHRAFYGGQEERRPLKRRLHP